MSGQHEDEPFLARWSRRKRQSSEQEPTPLEPHAAPAPAPDAHTIDLAALPKLEDLTASSDLAVFLQKGVPDLLKQQAMRRMWSLDPTIRDFVEMAENQYDWNAPGGVPGFGVLDPGTDVASLLDQALGRWPGRDAPSEPSEADHVDPAPDVARAADNNMRKPTSMPSLAASESGVDDAGTACVRSRHGGALPG